MDPRWVPTPPAAPHHSRVILTPRALRHTIPCPTHCPAPHPAQGEQQNEAQRRERTQLFTHHFNTANSYNRSELYTMTTREKEPRGDGSAKEWTDGV